MPFDHKTSSSKVAIWFVVRIEIRKWQCKKAPDYCNDKKMLQLSIAPQLLTPEITYSLSL